MKKVLFMLFAISAMGYGAVSTEGTENASNTVDETENIASINVEVTATVEETQSKLIITDEDDEPINKIIFDHHLIVGDLTNQKEASLSFKIKAKSSIISESNITPELIEDFSINTANKEASLSGKLAVEGGDISTDSDKITLSKEYTVKSTVTTPPTAEGVYSGFSAPLTIKIDKTK